MKNFAALIVICGALGTSALAVRADPITASVTPAITVSRGSTWLRILVERNDLNRMLTWEVDGPEYYRSSSVELDGAESPRSYQVLVKDLPAGEFVIRAAVIRADKSESVARCRLTVMPGVER